MWRHDQMTTTPTTKQSNLQAEKPNEIEELTSASTRSVETFKQKARENTLR